MPTPQTGQTYWNNLLATANELFDCVFGWSFVVKLVLKGLKDFDYLIANRRMVEAK